MQSRREADELTFAEVAEAVEGAFGTGCVGLGDSVSGTTTEEARSAFVRASLYLVVLQRVNGHFESQESTGDLKRKTTRKVREELADLLGVDVNEVFRLHHHAAGLRAKDPDYCEKARRIERSLAERHGMAV